jgi:hypothetical protein
MFTAIPTYGMSDLNPDAPLVVRLTHRQAEEIRALLLAQDSRLAVPFTVALASAGYEYEIERRCGMCGDDGLWPAMRQLPSWYAGDTAAPSSRRASTVAGGGAMSRRATCRRKRRAARRAAAPAWATTPTPVANDSPDPLPDEAPNDDLQPLGLPGPYGLRW